MMTLEKAKEIIDLAGFVRNPDISKTLSEAYGVCGTIYIQNIEFARQQHMVMLFDDVEITMVMSLRINPYELEGKRFYAEPYELTPIVSHAFKVILDHLDEEDEG